MIPSESGAGPPSDPAASGPYRPVDCALHDRYEALATLRTLCRIRFRAPDGTPEAAVGRIENLYARDGAEYLKLSGRAEPVRLDRIEGVEPVDPEG